MDTAYDDDPIPDVDEFQQNELMYFLSHSPEVQKTTSRALKQAAYAGTGVLVGGIVFGPFGGLVGGVTGSLVGYAKSDNYQGALAHISKLNDEQRKRLLREVGAVLMAAGATAPQLATAQQFRTTLITLAAQEEVRDAIWKACLKAARS